MEEFIPEVDHFKAYRVQQQVLAAPEIVGLKGQFDANFRPAQIESLRFLCTPVSKNNEGIIDNDHHLSWYKFLNPVPEPQRDVTIVNQFFPEGTTMRIHRGRSLLVPFQKTNPGNHPAPVGLDHYKLYEVIDAAPLNPIVSLSDQFFEGANQETDVPVLQARLFGVPVEKQHGEENFPINNERDHLVVYQVVNRNYVPPIAITGNDQFGNFNLNAFERRFLLVPSDKTNVVVVNPVVNPG